MQLENASALLLLTAAIYPGVASASRQRHQGTDASAGYHRDSGMHCSICASQLELHKALRVAPRVRFVPLPHQLVQATGRRLHTVAGRWTIAGRAHAEPAWRDAGPGAAVDGDHHTSSNLQVLPIPSLGATRNRASSLLCPQTSRTVARLPSGGAARRAWWGKGLPWPLCTTRRGGRRGRGAASA